MRTRLAVGRVIVYKSGGGWIRQRDPSLRTPLMNLAHNNGLNSCKDLTNGQGHGEVSLLSNVVTSIKTKCLRFFKDPSVFFKIKQRVGPAEKIH